MPLGIGSAVWLANVLPFPYFLWHLLFGPRRNQILAFAPNQTYGAVAFQNCTTAVKTNALQNAKLDPDFDPTNDFNAQRFADYMGRIETQFNCAGWCQTKYINGINGQTMMMSKYLFTNINRGPPGDRGCYYRVVNWIIPYLIAWGAVTLVMVGFQVICCLNLDYCFCDDFSYDACEKT
jgi:hypothetical protein